LKARSGRAWEGGRQRKKIGPAVRGRITRLDEKEKKGGGPAKECGSKEKWGGRALPATSCWEGKARIKTRGRERKRNEHRHLIIAGKEKPIDRAGGKTIQNSEHNCSVGPGRRENACGMSMIKVSPVMIKSETRGGSGRKRRRGKKGNFQLRKASLTWEKKRIW